MTANMHNPRSRAAGLIVTATALGAGLVAWLYAGSGVFGLAFPPFDLFDWLARALPGPIVTRGIDTMVALIGAAGLSIADTAKAAEQALAVGVFTAAVSALGAVLMLWPAPVRLSRNAGDSLLKDLAVAVGAVAGVASAALRAQLGGGGIGLVADTAWLVVAFIVWGVLVAWSRERIGLLPGAPGSGSPTDDYRRRFLWRFVSVAAFAVVGGGALGTVGRRLAATGAGIADRTRRWSARNELPNAAATVMPVPGTRPELTPLEDHYRIDINTVIPEVDGRSWRLAVEGLVERPLRLTMEELRAYAPTHLLVTLACISNQIAGGLIGTTRWSGVSLQALLPDLGLAPEATHLHIRSVDGFHEVVDLDTIRSDERIMLAYDWDGVPLTAEHGFPLRIYIPDRYGMKQPRWIESIEAVADWREGYWVERGWDAEARMNATSVIDTVSSDMMAIEAEPGAPVPIGGIAHAGSRGISRVEVRVDDGEWRQAEMREPLSDLTWVLWRYDWPMEPGDHTFTVRCIDGDGVPQVETMRPVRPSGATGLHSLRAMF